MVRMTHTQRKIMANAAAGRPLRLGQQSSMSASGGWDQSIRSCVRHGWLSHEFEITPAGRAALEAREGE